MVSQFRIAVAEGEPETRLLLRESLRRLGHEVVAVAGGRQLVELCRAAPPDLIVTGVRMPDGDALDAVEVVTRERAVPVVLVTAFAPEEMPRAERLPVMACLTRPFTPAKLGAAAHLAVTRFARLQEAHREAAGLRRALEERRLVERAKGAVMRRLRLSEEEAFRRLRRWAGSDNHRMAELAATVLEAEGVFWALERV